MWAKSGLGNIICQIFFLPFKASSRPPDRGIKRFPHLNSVVYMTQMSCQDQGKDRVTLCCQGCTGGILVHHVPKVLPSWRRQPKAAPRAPSTTGRMENSKHWGCEMAALNQKTFRWHLLQRKEDHRMIPIPGWCYPARVAHRDLSLGHRGIYSKSSSCCNAEPRVCSPGLTPSRSSGTECCAPGTGHVLQPHLGRFPPFAM